MQKKSPAKAGTTKLGTYQLVSKFPGYNARQDSTTLPVGTLIAPSQNVLIGTSGRIAPVKGYVLDGASSPVIDSGILSNFDFSTFKSDVRNMRAGFMSAAANNGKLQYRYVTGTSTVNWVDLKTSLTNIRLSFCEYWDNTNLIKQLLWVDGSNNVNSWNGAVTTIASATATTVTKQGTNTWAQEGFLQTGTRSIVIGGVSATYSGGEGTTTLTGLSVDFSATVVGSIAHQAVVTTALSAMTAISATFAPTVIGCGRQNQVYLGSSKSNNLYISKVNSFTDYTVTAPVRLVGDGALIPLDAPPVKFIAQEVHGQQDAYDMWISEGTDRWCVIRSRITLSPTASNEVLEHIRLKVAPLQGAMSERLVTKMKNHIVFVGNDKIINTLGYISYQYVPVMTDISSPIINDQTSYDLTDGSLFYHKNYIYETVPKAGVVRIYNMTDQTQEQYSAYNPVEEISQQPWFWEAPITYPISGFYVVNGELYGHSYTTSESYKLYTGAQFNGQQVDANATFSFDDKGDSTSTKLSSELWVEGYISQNTSLNCVIGGDLGSFQSSQTSIINGNDAGIVAYGSGGHALGKNPLGSQPLGGASLITSTLPAYFHAVLTYSPAPSYLEQISFNTKGLDLSWELIKFGTNAAFTNEGNNDLNR